MPRKVPDDIKALRGTIQPCRLVVPLYPEHMSRPDPAEIPPPAGMTPAGADVWKVKVERYRQRGQKVGGFEEALRQYCELEARLTELWNHRDGPPMAMVAAHRVWCGEFFDTPASQKVSIGKKTADNPFAKFGA